MAGSHWTYIHNYRCTFFVSRRVLQVHVSPAFAGDHLDRLVELMRGRGYVELRCIVSRWTETPGAQHSKSAGWKDWCVLCLLQTD